MSGTEGKIAAVCKGARVTPGLAVCGSDVDAAADAVQAWTQKNLR